jgi:hypothetical protein
MLPCLNKRKPGMQDRLMSEVTAMRHRVTNFFEIENVGMIDSVFRGSLGIAILLGVLLVPAISSSLLVSLTLVAIYLGLTAFLSWDPLYVLAKKFRSQAREGACATVIIQSVPRNSEPVVSDVPHKKAA